LLPIGVGVNPTSGKGKGAAAGALVLQTLSELGFQAMNLSAQSADDALAAARKAVTSGAIQALIVVGGDGVVHLGVNACAGTNVPLGIVAAGTGNDAALTLGLPLNDPAQATRAALSQLDEPKSIDLLAGKSEHGEFHAFNTVSAGFDALVNRRANLMSWPKGPSRYTVAMVLELFKFSGIKYRAVIDGTERKIEAMLCAVANGPSFGGGMFIAPHAKIDDGTLELFVVHKISRIELLKVFPKVFTGGHVTHPAVEFVSGERFTLDSGNLPAYADGEFVGNSPIDVWIAPKALRVLAA
jgi:diacylglycerol kinase (ATP)